MASQFMPHCIYILPANLDDYYKVIAHWWDDTLDVTFLKVIGQSIQLGHDKPEHENALYDDGIIRIEQHEDIENYQICIRFYRSSGIGKSVMQQVADGLKVISGTALLSADPDSEEAKRVLDDLRRQYAGEPIKAPKVPAVAKSGCLTMMAALCVIVSVVVAAVATIL